jgi:hypothetical protein
VISQIEKYLKHLPGCASNVSSEPQIPPLDPGCTCGLRVVYHQLKLDFEKLQRENE